MASSASSSSPIPDPKLDLIKEIRSHEVALTELNNLSSSRSVYQKNGNLFFRTTIQKQEHLNKSSLIRRRPIWES